jgi:hypothetical protein
LRNPNNDLTREALEWNPQEVRRRGRPRTTWRRTIEEEINRMRKSRKADREPSRNRVRWRNFTSLGVTGHHHHRRRHHYHHHHCYFLVFTKATAAASSHSLSRSPTTTVNLQRTFLPHCTTITDNKPLIASFLFEFLDFV